jgi:hypothetical protein
MKVLEILYILALMWVTTLVVLAPEGYEDATGFHYGPLPR